MSNPERQADPAEEAARLMRGQYPNDGWLVDDDPGVVQVAHVWATLGVYNQLERIANRLGEIADHLQQIRRHG